MGFQLLNISEFQLLESCAVEGRSTSLKGKQPASMSIPASQQEKALP